MHFLCINCWKVHLETVMLASCKECERLSGISRKDPLSSMRARDGLVCKDHERDPLAVFCPNCEKEISSLAAVGDQGVVTMIGDTASGKTCLLWSVSKSIRDPREAGYVIRKSLTDSDKNLRAVMNEFVQSGKLYAATPTTDAGVRNFAWQVIDTRDGSQSWIIAFHDASGELWRDIKVLSKETHELFFQYFDLASAVILTLDGAKLAQMLDEPGRGAHEATANEIEMMDALTERLSARGERIPVAVTVTKCDLLWDRADWTILREDSHATPEALDREVRQLLIECGRGFVVAAIEAAFYPCRYFAVSALGQSPAAGLSLDDYRGVRVKEPLVYLLDQMGGRYV